MTNYERIKEMTVEEMAVALCDRQNCDQCVGKELCVFRAGHANGLIQWLESEAEEYD